MERAQISDAGMAGKSDPCCKRSDCGYLAQSHRHSRAGSWEEEELIRVVPAELGLEGSGFGLRWEVSSKK